MNQCKFSSQRMALEKASPEFKILFASETLQAIKRYLEKSGAEKPTSHNSENERK